MRLLLQFTRLCAFIAAIAGLPHSAIGATSFESSDVDIGGRSMHLVCVGIPDPTRPTIIAEAALGFDSMSFATLLSKLDAASTHACAYDRAGMGFSDPAPAPATVDDGVADLRALLDATDLGPPYVLVAHSIGGWYARAFTDRYPDEVVGVVFVDSSHPDQEARMRAALPPPSPGEDPAITRMRDELSFSERFNASNSEVDLATSVGQLRGLGDLGDRPVVVLTQDLDWEPYGLPVPYEERLAAAWRMLQMELASLSTRGVQRVVPEVGHMIPQDRPDAVFEAILEVLAAIVEA